ncbi:hypothetical protein C8R45DRAFT_293100 [Mycena sanguinolenta]|nr:hypothetical protein C8R45DRAFT_293100 [Mycena sanguinolenta]
MGRRRSHRRGGTSSGEGGAALDAAAVFVEDGKKIRSPVDQDLPKRLSMLCEVKLLLPRAYVFSTFPLTSASVTSASHRRRRPLQVVSFDNSRHRRSTRAPIPLKFPALPTVLCCRRLPDTWLSASFRVSGRVPRCAHPPPPATSHPRRARTLSRVSRTAPSTSDGTRAGVSSPSLGRTARTSRPDAYGDADEYGDGDHTSRC